MENAITYKDLYLSFGEVISMDRLEIVQSPNRHGRLRLSAVLNGEGGGEVFDELPEDVSVLYKEDGEEKVLFKGMVTDSSMKRVGNHRKLELKAYDATYLLDTKRKTRSFQDTARTNHSVIAEVMKEYPECICMKNLPESPIGRIWFQYEETDWEFLRRFLSSYSDSLYADATYHTARFQAGLSPEDIEVEWDDCPYGMGKNLERYDFLSQNGFDGIGIDKFIEYSVDSYGLYTLGSRLVYKGRRWYVGKLERRLTDGLLTSTYRLQQREGLLTPQEYNRRITGVSLDGKTVQVQGDTVRVSMNGDMTTEQGTYWFPYSTVASSPDGSGWYSMPEVGDSIRVYFPTCDEKEGYVVTKHDSHMPATGKTPGGSSDGKQPQEEASKLQKEVSKVQKEVLKPQKIAVKQFEGALEQQAYSRQIKGASLHAKAVELQGNALQTSMSPNMAVKLGTRELRVSTDKVFTGAVSADTNILHSTPVMNGSIRAFTPVSDEADEDLSEEPGGLMSVPGKAPAGGSAKKSSGGRGSSTKKGGGGRSSSGGGEPGGDSGSGESGGSSDGGGESGGNSGGGGGESGGGLGGVAPAVGAAAGNADAPAEAVEKQADSGKEDPMDDPSKRNIFTQDGCVVQLVPAGVILTAGDSSLMLKKTGEIVMNAPLGISVYAGKKLTMTARKVTVKAGSLIELKDEAGADVAIRKQHIKMHGKEIFEN